MIHERFLDNEKIEKFEFFIIFDDHVVNAIAFIAKYNNYMIYEK